MSRKFINVSEKNLENNDRYVPENIRLLKRYFDIFSAVAGLILTSPLWPLIAAAIKITSPGPILFKQERIGRIWPNGPETFYMIKFRSMRENAEDLTGAVWAKRNDARLTPIGGILRKTRLDELPQFINVLIGDMSLIGPRPERPTITEDLEDAIPYYKERTFGISPGITGLAQINQGYDESLDDVRSKLAYDLTYSLSLTHYWKWIRMDCYIIFKTIVVMVMGRGQ